MRFTRPALCAAAALLLAGPSHTQTPRDGLVVSPAWLAEHLNDRNLVLLHVGDAAAYARGHIPGARFIQQQDITVHHDSSGLMLQMLPAQQLRERLEAFGISDDSRIVVYYGSDWVSPATRIIFTLDYAGLGGRVSLLDGGMPAWRAAGNAVTDRDPTVRRGTLRPLALRRELVVDAAWVQQHRSDAGIRLIDGRASSFYDGIEATGDRHGHIPGARSVPFTEITDDHLKLRSAADLAALFRAAGVRPGDTVVGYCHIGQQATAMLFAARTLGFNVKLYDGSMEDWGRRAELPVEDPRRGERR